MHCPYCHAPLTEELPACPRCGVNIDKATAYFGEPPRLQPDVTDPAGKLRPADLRSVRRRIGEFSRRFPQAGFSAVFMDLSPDVPGAAYAWWLFNRGLPGGETQHGGNNRRLLLLVDTAGRQAWLTQGYGLEPFVSEAQLRQCLERALPHLAMQDWAAAVLSMIEEIESMLRAVLTALPRIFGLKNPSAVLNPEPAAAT